MREKYNDASTGPDFYFEKALQSPEFSSSTFSAQNNYKFVLLPSSMRSSYDEGNASTTSTRPTLTYQSWAPAHKDQRYSPVHSPGSNATSRTSLCTDEDYEVEDGINSHCGSLCYSVESWTVGYTAEDIDDGYHAEDEDTTCNTAEVHRSAYQLEHGDDECFGVDICFQPLDWVNSLVKGIFGTIEAIPHDNESRAPSQRRLTDRYDAHGVA